MGLGSIVKKVVGGASKVIGGITGGDLLSFGGGLLGGQQANAASAASTKEQMAFQERMRATQYQTSVDDLRKAGLNPMLAYMNSAAGTPSGSAYTAQDVVTPAISSALAYRTARANIANLEASNDKIKSDTALNRDLQVSARADALLKTNNARVAANNAAISAAELPYARLKGDASASLTSSARQIKDFKFPGMSKSGQAFVDKLVKRYKETSR